MTEKTKVRIATFLKAIDIAQQIHIESNSWNDAMLNGYNNFRSINDFVNPSASQVRQMEKMFFTEWNEGISSTVEKFWLELGNLPNDYERVFPLKKAITLGRFRNVHEAMEAVENFNEMLESGLLNHNYSTSELEQIREIIDSTIKTRVEFLKKCIKNHRIPKSKFLYFGDCWAFVKNCNLIKSYFEDSELKTLNEISENFSFK